MRFTGLLGAFFWIRLLLSASWAKPARWRSSRSRRPRAGDRVTYFAGHGAGLVDSVRTAGQVLQELKEEFLEAVERMNRLLEG